MEQKCVTIKFDGQTHQVDLSTFLNVLFDYSTVVKACASKMGMADCLNISILATDQGSLDVILQLSEDLAAIGSTIPGIMDALGGVATFITVVGGIYGFKKWLGGKKKIERAKKSADGSVDVTADGTTINIAGDVYQVYADCPKAMQAINHTFETLDENPAIEGFEMSSDGKRMFRAERCEFSAIAASPNHEGEDIKHIEEDVWLQIVKPVLLNDTTRRWEFIWRGFKISGPIKDEDFFKNGIGLITMGSRMHARLNITQEYDHESLVWLNKSYQIIKVYEIDNPTETDSMLSD